MKLINIDNYILAYIHKVNFDEFEYIVCNEVDISKQYYFVIEKFKCIIKFWDVVNVKQPSQDDLKKITKQDIEDMMKSHNNLIKTLIEKDIEF